MEGDVISSLLVGINKDLQQTIENIQKKLEEEDDDASDEHETISALFDMGFGFTEFLREVFLHIPVADLLSCKLVCWQWKEFIEQEVWWKHSLVKNYWRWTGGVSSLLEVDCGGEVSHVASHQNLVVCAMKAGSILVVNADDFFVVAVLQSEAGQVWKVGVSSTIIVAVTAEQVIVWKSDTFQLVARVRHGSKFQPYLAVKDCVVVVPGSSRHVTRLLVYRGRSGRRTTGQGPDNERSLAALREFSHGTFWVLDADIDRWFVLTLALFAYGTITTRELRLWNGMDGVCLRTCDLGGGVAGTISLQFPHAAVTSGTKALAVWDMDTGKCKRKLQASASGVEIRGQFLYIVDKSAQVRMYRMREMEMEGDRELWQREFYHGNQGPSRGSAPVFTVGQDRIISLSSNKNRRNVLTVMQLFTSIQEATSRMP